MIMIKLDKSISDFIASSIKWMGSEQFYIQAGLILLTVLIAYALAVLLERYSVILRQEPTAGPWLQLKKMVHASRDLLFPLFTISGLGVAAELSRMAVQQIGRAHV